MKREETIQFAGEEDTWSSLIRKAGEESFVFNFNNIESFLVWWDKMFPISNLWKPIRRMGAGL